MNKLSDYFISFWDDSYIGSTSCLERDKREKYFKISFTIADRRYKETDEVMNGCFEI